MINVSGITDYCLKIKKGEKVFIFADDKSRKYCNLLCKRIIIIGAVPFVLWNDFKINTMLIKNQDDNIYENMFKINEKMIDACDVAIMLDNNIETYLKKLDPKKVLNFKNKYYLKIFKKIMNFPRWVYLRYPQKELSSLFGLTYDEHLRLLEDVSNFDYQFLYKSCACLKDLLDNTKKIRVFHPNGTDVTFKKDGIATFICCGECNLPDGEVYTAPEKHSMNGRICFNIDSYFRGELYSGIKLKINNGKVIESTCNIPNEFEAVLNSDEGARYFGEFAFGLNPYITRNYNDNLFNEKMIKTIHFAIGYPHYNTDNGNKSLVHWDLILNLENGGEVYFDDILIQKNGVFTDKRLEELNFKKVN